MLSLIYPKICLHCRSPLGRRKGRFCLPCNQLFDLLPTAGRCSQCFTEIAQQQGSCTVCRKRWAPLRKVAVCFDSFGPAGELLRAFKEGCQRPLAKDLAAFMVVQLEKQNWHTPEMIIPVPLPGWKKMWRGYNQSLLIAREMGKLLQLPVIDPLKRRVGQFSSHLLEKKERGAVDSKATVWKKKPPDLENRILLLVDDLMVTGATLRAAAARLQDTWPKAVYGLTFCGTT